MSSPGLLKVAGRAAGRMAFAGLAPIPIAAAASAPVEVRDLPGVEAARALVATPEWAAFRSFWRSAGASPAEEEQNWELLQAQRDSLRSLAAELDRASPDSTASYCAALLGRLCEARLSMTRYGLPEMLTRMIPSRAVFHEEASLRRLEGRLAALGELTPGAFRDPAEVAGLLGDAVEEATAAILFDAMSDVRLLPETFPGAEADSLGTAELLAFDLASLDSLTRAAAGSDPRLEAACEDALAEVRRIRSSLPALEIMLGDLLAPR